LIHAMHLVSIREHPEDKGHFYKYEMLSSS